jgi:hypothetical protein
VVSGRGEGVFDASGGGQEGVPESIQLEFSGWVCVVEVSFARLRWHRMRGVWLFSRDGLGGRLDDWLGGAWCGGGVSLVCGSGTERERASVESGCPGLRVGSTGGERERANGGNRRL